VTERGVVFSIDPLPVLDDSDSSTDSTTTDSTTTDSTTTDDTTTSTTDETGPVITSSTESSFSTTEEAILVVSTDENATCRYNAGFDEDYGEMTSVLSSSFGTGHHVVLGVLEEGDYTFYVRCKDEEANTTTPGKEILFQVDDDDDEAPVLSGLFPSSDTVSSTSVTLSLSTDVDARCKYTTSDSGMDYNDMKKEFDITGGTGHSEPVSGLVSGDSYIYYVRCKNTSTGVVNTISSEISFTVDGTDTTPPTITSTTSSSFTDAEDVIVTVTTNEVAYCGYSEVYSTDIDDYDAIPTSDGITHKVNLGDTLLIDSYTYYVSCQDESGNATTFPEEILFDVVTASLYKNSIFYTDEQLAFSSSMKASMSTALETVGNLFVSTAIAQDTTDTTDTTTDTTDADTEDSDFLEEGNVEEGSGTGKFTARLEDLKPGTFFYARAYAVIGGTTYYGNQVGFQTADSCFVATAAYGSLFHPAVQLLRDFRDRFMLDNSVSRSMVRMYYRYSPPIADIISSNTILRPVTRTLLMPIVGSAWLTMHFGWLWLILPAAAMALLSWFGMQRMQVVRQEEL